MDREPQSLPLPRGTSHVPSCTSCCGVTATLLQSGLVTCPGTAQGPAATQGPPRPRPCAGTSHGPTSCSTTGRGPVTRLGADQGPSTYVGAGQGLLTCLGSEPRSHDAPRGHPRSRQPPPWRGTCPAPAQASNSGLGTHPPMQTNVPQYWLVPQQPQGDSGTAVSVHPPLSCQSSIWKRTQKCHLETLLPPHQAGALPAKEDRCAANLPALS